MKRVRTVSVSAAGLALMVLLVAGIVRAAPGDIVRSKNCQVTSIERGLPIPVNYNPSYTCGWGGVSSEDETVLVTFACDGGALAVRMAESSLVKGLFAAQLQASLNQGKKFKDITTRSLTWVVTSDCSKCSEPTSCSESLTYWGLTAGSTITRNVLMAWKM